MATLADIEELAIKNRLLDVEEREITIGFQRHNEQEVYRLVSSFLIGGMTQQGKSVIAAYLACQFVLCGARLICIDPHCANEKRGLTHKIEPLREWFALPPVDFSDIDEVIERFAWLGQEYTRRKQPGGMQNAFPLLCLIDEFNEFLTGCGLSKQQKAFVSQVVSNVARGGAKHGLFVGIILHNADVSKSGGSEVRYNITTRIAVNCESREQCKILDYDDKGHIEEQCIPPLQPGDALVKLPGYPPHVFCWPHVTCEYCALVARFVRKIEYSDYSDMPSIHDLKPLNTVQKNGTIQPLQPGRYKELYKKDDLNMGLNMDVSEEEYRMIVDEGNKQLKETGKVVRTLIRDHLGWDNYAYEKKIKPVCDLLGWHYKMSQRKLSADNWQAVKERYNFTCLRCGKTEPEIVLEPDRVVPGALGGNYDLDNIQPLCRSCNASKGAARMDYRQEVHV